MVSNPILFLDDGGEGIPIPVEALVQAIVILCVDVLIIVTNVIIIATFITAPGPKEVMTYYLLSLSVADLLGKGGNFRILSKLISRRNPSYIYIAITIYFVRCLQLA